MVQEATMPLSTRLFSTEKAPESHFPSKSTVSIHTPISLEGVGCLGHEGGDFWVVAAAEGGALGVGRATFLKRAMQRRAIFPSGPGRVPRGGLVAGFRRGGFQADEGLRCVEGGVGEGRDGDVAPLRVSRIGRLKFSQIDRFRRGPLERMWSDCDFPTGFPFRKT